MIDTTSYAVRLEPQTDGGYTVTFPGVPEAITEGDDHDDALRNAVDALTLCLEQRLEDGDPIPEGRNTEGDLRIQPAVAVQVALLVRRTREARGLTVVDLAQALDVSSPTVRGLEQASVDLTLQQLDQVADALGTRLIISMR